MNQFPTSALRPAASDPAEGNALIRPAAVLLMD